MDEIDLRLCQLLFANSRRPQRELADELGIGVAVVHRRIQSLVDQGVIKGFNANLSTSYLGAVHAQVVGVCDCQSVAESLGALSKSGSVFSVLTSAANLTSVMLLLRSINDLGPTVELIRGALKMPQPKVTISMKILVGNEPVEKEFTGNRELSLLDYRIVNSLHLNSRKPIVDLADEIDITPKTARSRLEAMEREGAIEYGFNWDPARTVGTSFIVRIDLKPGTDRSSFISQLNKRYGARFIYTFIFSNMFDYVGGYCWASTVSQHNELVGALRGDEAVANVRSSIVHDLWGFETWRDRLLRERASGPRHPVPARQG
jgi:DNA-binding Lrp family transcriptional regulator